jgi:hypothetical protein
MDQQDKSIEFLQEEYDHKFWQYMRALENRTRFIHEQIPALAHIMIPRTAPRSYSARALSEPVIFQTIKDQGTLSFIPDIMRKLCSR